MQGNEAVAEGALAAGVVGGRRHPAAEEHHQQNGECDHRGTSQERSITWHDPFRVHPKDERD